MWPTAATPGRAPELAAQITDQQGMRQCFDAVIDMPLYQVINGAKKEQEEDDRAKTLQHAEAALQKATETTKRGRGRPRLK